MLLFNLIQVLWKLSTKIETIGKLHSCIISVAHKEMKVAHIIIKQNYYVLAKVLCFKTHRSMKKTMLMVELVVFLEGNSPFISYPKIWLEIITYKYSFHFFYKQFCKFKKEVNFNNDLQNMAKTMKKITFIILLSSYLNIYKILRYIINNLISIWTRTIT